MLFTYSSILDPGIFITVSNSVCWFWDLILSCLQANKLACYYFIDASVCLSWFSWPSFTWGLVGSLHMKLAILYDRNTELGNPLLLQQAVSNSAFCVEWVYYLIFQFALCKHNLEKWSGLFIFGIPWMPNVHYANCPWHSASPNRSFQFWYLFLIILRERNFLHKNF